MRVCLCVCLFSLSGLQAILALFELTCEEFQGWLPEHVESIRTNNGSRCFYQCVNEIPFMYVPGTSEKQPTIYRWQHDNKHEIPTGKTAVEGGGTW